MSRSSTGPALSIAASVNAEVIVGPRVYYAMARNKAFFSAAAKVDPRWHTPVNAILSQGLCAMLMTVTTADWADHYSQLAIYLRLNGVLPPTARGS